MIPEIDRWIDHERRAGDMAVQTADELELLVEDLKSEYALFQTHHLKQFRLQFGIAVGRPPRCLKCGGGGTACFMQQLPRFCFGQRAEELLEVSSATVNGYRWRYDAFFTICGRLGIL